MLKDGLTKQEILKTLEKKLSKDLSYESGYILGSMCTKPLNFGRDIYIKYLEKNLGDPGLFPGSAELENELVTEIGELFGSSNVVGTFTTGGSEANIIAMRIAKKIRSDIKDPEIVVPISAHISFDKGADLLGIKLRKARVNNNYELDLNHFESLINENTCGVVGIAGTTSLGLIDPIKEIAKIIENRNIFLHIDAAFGGFVLPFLKELNYEVTDWDFNVNDVNSITADPHKMGLGIIPCGGLFLRKSEKLEKSFFEIPYLAGGTFKHLQFVGTRPGGPVIAFWAIMKYLGKKGFMEVIDNCMKNTKYLSSRVSEIKGIKLATKPILNIVGITTESGKSICEIEKELRKKNWMLGNFTELNLIRIVIMPHVRESHLSKFLDDLQLIVKKLKI